MEHDRQRSETETTEGVEVWGRDVTREEFLEGRYGASSEAEANEARAGGDVVTPTEVETEHVEAQGDVPVQAAEQGDYNPDRDPLSHGMSRSETRIAES